MNANNQNPLYALMAQHQLIAEAKTSVRLSPTRLHFYNQKITLDPAVKLITHIFFKHRKESLSDVEILEAFPPHPHEAHAARRTRAIKALSRARKLLRKKISSAGEMDILWLPYDEEEKVWRIFQFKPLTPLIHLRQECYEPYLSGAKQRVQK